MAFDSQFSQPFPVLNAHTPFFTSGNPRVDDHTSSTRTSGRQTVRPSGFSWVPCYDETSPTTERPAPSLTAITEGLRLAFLLCLASLLTLFRLFGDSEYSNLELRWGNRTWKVHWVIVCGRCEFFEACVDRNFNVSQATVTPNLT